MESSRAYDAEARRARAERILDVAAEQLLRWGYKRLTMDDVAAHAGIGKGTIYLHWKTRDALFEAVLKRELRGLIEDIAVAVREDPQNALPHRMGRHYFMFMMRRPLLRALFAGDPEVLGKLANIGRLQSPELQRIRLEFVRLLAEYGLVRTDLSADELAYAMRTIIVGFVLADPYFKDEQPTLERRADLLALALQTFELDARPSKKALQDIAEYVLHLFAELLQQE